MKVDVRNRGNVASAATKVYFYLHKDTADYGSASKIGEVNVPSINPGQATTDLTFSYTVPASSPQETTISVTGSMPRIWLLKAGKMTIRASGTWRSAMPPIWCRPTTLSARYRESG